MLTTVIAFLLAIALSFLSIMPFVPTGDDSPGLGFLWLLVFFAETSLLVPLSLGVTAELIERKVQGRSFEWLKALKRFLIAVPIATAPLYYCVYVWPFIESRRPAFWIWKEVLFCGISCAAAYFALRIRRIVRTV
jgi:hypothetical protein